MFKRNYQKYLIETVSNFITNKMILQSGYMQLQIPKTTTFKA